MRRHLTYANVVSSICLFTVLGGVSYAGVQQLARNSVGASQIRTNAVGASEVRDGSLGVKELSRSALATLSRVGPAGAPGLTGPGGPQGGPGAVGAAGRNGTNGTNGTNGVSGLQVVTAQGTTVEGPSSDRSSATASCPAGKRVIAGRTEFFELAAATSPTVVETGESFPSSNQDWFASMTSNYGDDWQIRVHAVCITAN